MKDTPWWICTPCRSLPSAVSALSVTLVQMRDKMSQIMETNNALMKSIKHLSVKNGVLKSQIASLSDEVIKVVNSQNSPKPPTVDQSERSKSPTLLIGGSSVRDVACMDPSSLLVKSRGGAKTGYVLKSLKEMDTDSYGDVTIYFGTNDCATKCPTDKIFSNFRDLSVHAKRVSRTVIVKFSSITPRVDNPVAAARGI